VDEAAVAEGTNAPVNAVAARSTAAALVRVCFMEISVARKITARQS
jgi:hypothetical protein